MKKNLMVVDIYAGEKRGKLEIIRISHDKNPRFLTGWEMQHFTKTSGWFCFFSGSNSPDIIF